ncbi:MAG: ABC transporter ATP-binding protein [Xanthobacteraceae bacterium]|nr:ABC transporter ATP-binding protein [Xanthobacteraceae bacterium]
MAALIDSNALNTAAPAGPAGPAGAASAALSHVSMSYDGKLEVLHDIDFKLNEGEFLSIVGPSGCGKSTILRLISGLAQPSKGIVEVASHAGKPSHVGFMFQRDALLPWADVNANIAVGLECAGVPKERHAARIKELLDLLGLAEFGHYYPRALSGGMRQRVALGRLLAYDSDIMLMDEPFGALDAQTKMMMGYELLRIWTENRKSVVFVTHDIEEAIGLSDRILVMSARPGRIKSEYRVELPRPRDLRGVRKLPAFHELSEKIWRDIVA